ncbi:hypothetical protein ACIQU6_29155 [Streptomyces sp. NPDC090442]|uniref:hypothetical protein n=1 Tax=Streptomyces sp. NPDC090442 TaxID=3365962 RepID=UPI00380E5B40
MRDALSGGADPDPPPAHSVEINALVHDDGNGVPLLTTTCTWARTVLTENGARELADHGSGRCAHSRTSWTRKTPRKTPTDRTLPKCP